MPRLQKTAITPDENRMLYMACKGMARHFLTLAQDPPLLQVEGEEGNKAHARRWNQLAEKFAPNIEPIQ